jgi:hypothetical protein
MGLLGAIPVIAGFVLPHAALRGVAGLAGLAVAAGAAEHATGEVIAMADVRAGRLPAGMSMADVTFQVRLGDGRSYVARSRIGFTAPDRRARIASLGALLPLWVDTRDRSRIFVDVEALGLAAAGGPG